MQRKQNLGMNAILSASLALARALAHVQGKELYELLREEMMGIIDDLAGEFDVEVQGSRFADYVAALQEVNEILDGQHKPLFETLRDLTGIYDAAGGKSSKRRFSRPDAAPEFRPPTVEQRQRKPRAVHRLRSRSPGLLRGVSRLRYRRLSHLPRRKVLSAFNRQLYRAYVERDKTVDIKKTLSIYQQTRADLTQRVARFGIVNNRVFQHDQSLWIPYLLGNTFLLHLVRGDSHRNRHRPQVPERNDLHGQPLPGAR